MRQPNKDLSARELEVLTWAAKGKTSSETAQIIGIKFASVRSYVNSLLLKLDAMNIQHAVALGYEHGILAPRPPIPSLMSPFRVELACEA